MKKTKKFDLRRIEEEQRIWSRRNFGPKHGTGYRPLLGVIEEVGELAHAQLKQEQGIRGTFAEHHAAKIDAAGDIAIYLMDYCHQQGFLLCDAIESAWGEVSKRNWKKHKKTGRGK